MKFPRSSGILLHPTSLPGRFGIGDLGPRAEGFVDFLAETGQRWWQVLPLGATGGMNSPYQSHSSFAGNPLLIQATFRLSVRSKRPLWNSARHGGVTRGSSRQWVRSQNAVMWHYC